ncbi:hypothetical protein DSO57_1013188 [Entomophthora muscae]|uniref:Uncharacterized protein n=1 Tax=Entomophthora muscae TaxID=34485 RepID=A0ACC2RKM2_9FUNG|nr:hypothetical protein DSO57_1013188 [Entomophthora muscae]
MDIFNTQVVQREIQLSPCLQPAHGITYDPKIYACFLTQPPNQPYQKLFIVYITLTGVIDTIILAAGPWSWVGKSVSYLFKLAPLLWWAFPAKNPAQVTPGNNRPAAQDWIPDKDIQGYRRASDLIE